MNHICPIANTLCSICQAQLDDEDELVRLPCNENHLLHKSCYDSYVGYGNILCPLCRGPISSFCYENQRKAELLKYCTKKPLLKSVCGFCILLEVKCKACGLEQYDFERTFCQSCEAVHLDVVSDFQVQKSELFKALKSGSVIANLDGEKLASLRAKIERFPLLYQKSMRPGYGNVLIILVFVGFAALVVKLSVLE